MPSLETQKLLEAWCNPRAFGTTLLVLYQDQFGQVKPGDAHPLNWDPRTIELEVAELLGEPLPLANFDRLLAAIAILTTDLFFENVPSFIQLCRVLSGARFDPGVFEPADAVECAWGISESLILAPPDRETPEPFGIAIRKYLGVVLSEEGIIAPPDVLRIALRPDGTDWTDKVSSQFSDDPELFGAIWDVENAKTKEINDALIDNLQELRLQLSVLPLVRGDVADVLRRLDRILETKETDDGSEEEQQTEGIEGQEVGEEGW